MVLILCCIQIWPRGYKTFFILNSVEHEILNAYKYENMKQFIIFQAQISLECYFLLLINVKMPTIVGIVTFMSRKISCSVEHEKSFITSGPGAPTGFLETLKTARFIVGF